MTDEQRAEYATHLRRTRTVAVVDEAHQALALEGQEMPRPFAAYAPDTITIGSASKAFWGGLRLGWLRAPHARMDALTQARLGLDLGAPVLEQLVLARLLGRRRTRSWPRTGPGSASSATRWPRRSRASCPSGGSSCPAVGWRCGASCPAPAGDRGGRRRRGPRRDRRARAGVRRRGRARPLRPDPLDPPRRRARAAVVPPRRRLGHRLQGGLRPRNTRLTPRLTVA